MDFHSLSRRELQALCKRNKIPANLTNVAMADSLKALEIVEGIEEVLQACKSEISQSSVEPRVRLEVTSPYVPCTGGRSTRQKDVLLTPAQSGVTSRRRRAAKEDSAVKQVYGTRRSERLAEKSAKLLKGVTLFSKKDLFTGDGQEFKMNLEESLDGSDEVSGVTVTVESERKDGQVDSGDKQDVSTDVELVPAIEEEMSNHSENDGGKKLECSSNVENNERGDGSQSFVFASVDVNTSVNFEEKDESEVEVVEPVPTIEEEHHSTINDVKVELNESRSAEIEQVGFGSEIGEFGNQNDDTKASNDDILALALNLNNEAQQTNGSDAVLTPETKMTRIKAEKIVEENTTEDAESVDEAVTENEGDFPIAELSSDTVIHSDDEICIDVDSNPHEVIAFDENEKDPEQTDSSETYSNPDESDSVNLDLTEESTKSIDSLACTPSEISLMSDEDDAFNWDDNNTANQDVAAEEETETVRTATNVTAKQDVAADDSPTHQLATVVPNNIRTAFTIPPTSSTPKRASASKASSRMIRVAAVSDNKENIGSGSKTAPAKERSKIVKEIAEAVPVLDDPSLMKLSKNLKELTITQNLDKNEGENVASARTALQALPDNQKAN